MDDELHEPGAVAQVDEDQPAVVAAAVDPAGHADLVADARGGQVAGPGVAVAVGCRRVLHPQMASRDDAGDRGRGGVHVLLLAGVHVAQPDAVGAQDGNVAGTGAIGLLELALERAPGQLLLDGEPGGARLGGQREGLHPAVLVRRRRGR